MDKYLMFTTHFSLDPRFFNTHDFCHGCVKNVKGTAEYKVIKKSLEEPWIIFNSYGNAVDKKLQQQISAQADKVFCIEEIKTFLVGMTNNPAYDVSIEYSECNSEKNRDTDRSRWIICVGSKSEEFQVKPYYEHDGLWPSSGHTPQFAVPAGNPYLIALISFHKLQDKARNISNKLRQDRKDQDSFVLIKRGLTVPTPEQTFSAYDLERMREYLKMIDIVESMPDGDTKRGLQNLYPRVERAPTPRFSWGFAT